MRDLGLEGVRRGKKIRTTIRDDGQERAADLEFQDTYTEALEQIIEAKREDREPPKRESEPGQIVDLMAALNESVQKARASRGEDADVHELPKKTAKKQPTKKTAAKKTAAKKTTKKATAKKTSRRRPRSA
jgi:DNA end-binding protein Ku